LCDDEGNEETNGKQNKAMHIVDKKFIIAINSML